MKNNYYLVELEHYQEDKAYRAVFYFMAKEKPKKFLLILQLYMQEKFGYYLDFTKSLKPQWDVFITQISKPLQGADKLFIADLLQKDLNDAMDEFHAIEFDWRER